MDNDLQCSPAPAPAPQDDSAKTEIIAKPGNGSSKAAYVFAGVILVLALAAGVLWKRSSGGTASASASAEAATEGSGSSATAATATGSDGAAAACAGEITDAQLRWYCTEFLPFAKKAAADHGRLDRLEAEKRSGGSDVPLALWVVLIGFGLLTTVNTVLILSKGKKKTEETPPAG
ncbi:MAG TPA: hypothetical protein VL283_01235 [Candidatus Baltobacteraceae bacterium]|nr:hypothetical protein [Candidatus Baltobacteraceae bacterium]